MAGHVRRLEERLKKECRRLRLFDPAAQLDLFWRLLEDLPDGSPSVLGQWMRQRVKHLLVDDLQDTTPAVHALIEWLKPTLTSLTLAGHLEGAATQPTQPVALAFSSHRTGFLSAAPQHAQSLLNASIDITPLQEARLLAEAWLAPESSSVWHTVDPEAIHIQQPSPAPSLEFLRNQLAETLTGLLTTYAPQDLGIVVPEDQGWDTAQLVATCNQLGIPCHLLDNTARVAEDARAVAWLTLLRLTRTQGTKQTHFHHAALRSLLLQLLPQHKQALQCLSSDDLNFWLTALTAPLNPIPYPANSPAVNPEELPLTTTLWDLRTWLAEAHAIPTESLLYQSFNKWVQPLLQTHDTGMLFDRVIQSFQTYAWIYATQYRQADTQGDTPTRDDLDQQWLDHVLTTDIANSLEQPLTPPETALVIGTPLRLVETEMRRKVYIWWHTRSRLWRKTDTAPLYHGWLMSNQWPDAAISLWQIAYPDTPVPDEGGLIDWLRTGRGADWFVRLRAANTTYALRLLAQDQVIALESETDADGTLLPIQDRLAGILPPRPGSTQIPLPRPTLREDQRPVLEYTGGQMAIAAAPGAGKTFTSVALLLQLIDQGVDPRSILVVTYMESAAQTFLERLRRFLPHLGDHQLPTICTIHALALRIVTNPAYQHLLLSPMDQFGVLSDVERFRILEPLITQYVPPNKAMTSIDSADLARAIASVIDRLKMSAIATMTADITLSPTRLRTREGLYTLYPHLPMMDAKALLKECHLDALWEGYHQACQREGYWDFNDLILEAIHLLSTHPTILEQWQERFQFILEDEAQDSSLGLQALLTILGGKNPNLVRVGDTNQSITTTFSTATTDVFRAFLADPRTTLVPIRTSGRSAAQIIQLANHLVEATPTRFPEAVQAFQPMVIQPTDHQNPTLLFPIQSRIFETQDAELAYLAETLQDLTTLSQEGQSLSVALLCRTRFQASELCRQLDPFGITVDTVQDEAVNEPPAFTLVASWLEATQQEPGWPSLMTELTSLYPHSEFHLDTDPDDWLAQAFFDWLTASTLCHEADPFPLSRHLLTSLKKLGLFPTEGSPDAFYAALQRYLRQRRTRRQADYATARDLLLAFLIDCRTRRTYPGFTPPRPLSDEVAVHSPIVAMTLHKSKGQEFDVVILPNLTATYYRWQTQPGQPDSIRFETADQLWRDLQWLEARTQGRLLSKPDVEARLRREKVEEELRLFYVGITRAKRGLILTSHTQANTRQGKRGRNVKPAACFQLVEHLLQEVPPKCLTP